MPTFNGNKQTTYSCVNDIEENCEYDVHVVAIKGSNGDVISWARVLSTGNTSIQLSVSGDGKLPLVLVLISHYPVNWSLSIPNGVVIERILQASACTVSYTHLTLPTIYSV